MANRNRSHSYWSQRTGVRFLFFVVSLVAILFVTAVVVPSAQIEIAPELRSQDEILEVSAILDENVIDPPEGLPTFSISLVVEGREVLTTTGTTPVPIQPAEGSVIFTNLTDLGVNIPAGTIVSTLGASPVRFSTQREGRLAAGSGNEIQLPITAATPGVEGNLPAGTILAIEGPLGLRLSVTNPTRTTGGQDFKVPAPTLKDQQDLSKLLSEKLVNTARSELLSLYGDFSSNEVQLDNSPPGNFPVLPTLKIKSVIEETFEPADFQPASQLELTMRLEFEARVVSGQGLESAALTTLDSHLPDGYEAVPGSLVISHVSQPVLQEDGQAHWQINASRQLQAVIKPGDVTNLAAGVRSNHAPAYLAAQLPLQKPPTIHPNITWWPYMPFLPFRMQVVEADTSR